MNYLFYINATYCKHNFENIFNVCLKFYADSAQKAFDTCRKGNYEYVINCAAETKYGHSDAVSDL